MTDAPKHPTVDTHVARESGETGQKQEQGPALGPCPRNLASHP